MNAYAIWLLGDMDEYNSCIKKLAKLNNTDLFPAHLTLCSGFDEEILMEWPSLKKQIQKELPLNVFAKNIEFQELYFKSIVMTLAKSAKLDALHEILKPFQKKRTIFDAHISLYYGDNTEIEKKEQMKQFKFLTQTIKLTELVLVEAKNGNWKAISDWRYHS